MIKTFPFEVHNQKLVVEDFIRFSDSFKDIVRTHLPTTEEVHFVVPHPVGEVDLSPKIKDAIAVAIAHEVRVVVDEEYLLILFVTKGGIVAAVAHGVDQLILQKGSHDWLEDVRATILNKFFLLKQARVDSETGLLNLSNLYFVLQRFNVIEGGGLILIELPPKITGSISSYQHLQKSVKLLNYFAGGYGSLHYLGQSVFCLVISSSEEPFQQAVRMVSLLKREGVRRVHVGVSSSAVQPTVDIQKIDRGRVVLNQAWTALQEAVTRGPYSFCDYHSLVNVDRHPLAVAPVSLRRKLSSLTRTLDSFCLLLFKSNSLDLEKFSQLLNGKYDSKHIFHWGKEYCVLLPLHSSQAGYDNAVETIKSFADHECIVSAGVSYFPHTGFAKADMVGQSRKALLHTAFYGEGTATLFDATSCNISGDIFYSDGDFNKACKEYKLGLCCDPADVNLLNSLGVTYAMMGRKSALDCFNKALEVESNNFMALYNKGLHLQSTAQDHLAMDCFERALDCCEKTSEVVAHEDVQLQLGMLCSKTNCPERALELLLPLLQETSVLRNDDILFYVGKSYSDIGNRKKAIQWLQRALTAHCLEDQSFSLLGYLYFLENEGIDVALSLCRKSVELNTTDQLLALRFANVLLGAGQVDESLVIARKCMRNKKLKDEACRLVLKIYTQQGELGKARRLSVKQL